MKIIVYGKHYTKSYSVSREYRKNYEYYYGHSVPAFKPYYCILENVASSDESFYENEVDSIFVHMKTIKINGEDIPIKDIVYDADNDVYLCYTDKELSFTDDKKRFEEIKNIVDELNAKECEEEKYARREIEKGDNTKGIFKQIFEFFKSKMDKN